MKNKNKKPKLTGIYLNKFQSIRKPTFINIENLTFLYGPNSAGKSAILDVLKILAFAVDQSPLTAVEKRGFNAGYLLESLGGDYEASVGVEYIQGEFDRDDKQMREWGETVRDYDECPHTEFHEALVGKRVQIEFAKGFRIVKVAVEGEPLLELHGGWAHSFSDLHKRAETNEEDPGDNDVWGTCIFYKKCTYFQLIEKHVAHFLSARSMRQQSISDYRELYLGYHYPLFVDDTDDVLSISGVDFSLRGDSSTQAMVHSDANWILFKDCPSAELLARKSAEVREFFDEHFNPKGARYSQHYERRNALYWALDDLAKILDLFAQGFLFQLSLALRASTVRGDRGLLNSTKPFYVTERTPFSQMCSVADEDRHMSAFAHSLADGWTYPKPVLDPGYVKKCLERYVSSLRGHSVVPKIYTAKAKGKKVSQDDDASTIVLLRVKTPNGKVLGFEDVGSGLSYIFPILTSLWASELSFIEQPELHLHPAAQCEMGDVFISAFNGGANAVVESHSEHLLLRVLRRIRETTKGIRIPEELKLKVEDVAIYYFLPLPDGHTEVRRIRVDRHGEFLDVWPGGFFAERDAELFA